jgi:hypothetical protein
MAHLGDRDPRLGYVTCSAYEDHGRGLYAALTDAVAEKLEAARRTHREGVRTDFLDHLSATDQVVLGDVWTRFLITTRA